MEEKIKSDQGPYIYEHINNKEKKTKYNLKWTFEKQWTMVFNSIWTTLTAIFFGIRNGLKLIKCEVSLGWPIKQIGGLHCLFRMNDLVIMDVLEISDLFLSQWDM